tara:strand:- start:5724 stop:6374 length:651 start_codon:yes stop_codon:yes gene_type:complete
MFKLKKILNNQLFYYIWRNLTVSKKYTIFNSLSDPNLVKGKKILDIGCGDGYILEQLIKNFDIVKFEYLGIDNNKNYISNAKLNFSNYKDSSIEFIELDINNIEKLNLKEFDLIISNGFFHHISDDEILDFFKKIDKFSFHQLEFIFIDPVFYEKQFFLRKFIMSFDRGEFIRSKDHYLKLFQRSKLEIISSVINNKLSNIMYSNLITHAKKNTTK